MIALVTFLVVILISILVTRVATVALTHTGLTKEAARFQARSAFTGTGFTTRESETVVNHPVRRRIVMILILFGNAGLVTAISSFVLTFVRGSQSSTLSIRLGILLGGLLILWLFASSKWVDRGLSRLIDRLLRRYTELDVTDYASLLHLTGSYRLAELGVSSDDWLEGRTLEGAQLRQEGVIILGIERNDGTYIGSPRGKAEVRAGDTLIAYGTIEAIKRLDRRKRGYDGDRDHRDAVRGQEEVLQKEAAEDRESLSGDSVGPQGG